MPEFPGSLDSNLEMPRGDRIYKRVGVGLCVGVIDIRQHLKPLRTWNKRIGTRGEARNTSAFIG